ncbi:hypothetical protein B0H14DRAFT_2579021 [Mycena olivaceomarginata]|nr:hypothetical protein B0H14DRAFT_2579021 [Mycena olivaceomarginata]
MPHPQSDSSAKLCELHQCGVSQTKRAILACMRSIIAIRKRRSMIPILFFSFLPPSSSLLYPSSTTPTPSLLHPPSTAWNIFGMQPVLYGNGEIIIVVMRKYPPFTSNRVELLLSHWSYSEGREQRRGEGAREMWRLAGASRNTSDADLGVLETRAIFPGRQGQT